MRKKTLLFCFLCCYIIAALSSCSATQTTIDHSESHHIDSSYVQMQLQQLVLIQPANNLNSQYLTQVQLSMYSTTQSLLKALVHSRRQLIHRICGSTVVKQRHLQSISPQARALRAHLA